LKHATVIRLGAIGDAVWTLPVIRELHADGYEISVHCKQMSAPVYKNNPYIKDVYLYPNEPGTKVDIRVPNGSRVIELDNTVEGKLLSDTLPVGCTTHVQAYSLQCPNCAAAKKNRSTTVNYTEEQLRVAGYPGSDPSTLGEIRLAQEDMEEVKDIISSWGISYVVLWSLANVRHKQYREWFSLMLEFCAQHPDVLVYTMGVPECSVYEATAHRICSGHWPLSQSITLIAHANLVIGGETGPMNIASCFDNDKLLFLSHSSRENLCKHWTNTVTVTPNSECHPCYQLHRTLDSCPTRRIKTGTADYLPKVPICTTDYDQHELLNILNRIKSRI